MRWIALGWLVVGTLGCGRSIDGHATEWKTPVQPVFYQVQGRVEMTMADAPEAFGPMSISLDLCVSVAPDAQRGGWIVRQGPIELGMGALGMQGSGGQNTPPDFMAPVLLDVNGGTLAEHDGPTKMWSAFDSLLGLVWLWPDLPTGASGTWEVPLHAKTDAIGVETRRGQSQVPPGMRLPPVGEAQVQTVATRWKDPTTLTGAWSHSGGGSDDVTVDRESFTVDSSGEVAGEGTWVIRDGFLEQATIHQEATIQLGMGGAGGPGGMSVSMTQTHVLDITASQVSECSTNGQTSWPGSE